MPSPASLKALLFPPLLNTKYKTRGRNFPRVRARCDAELPQFISIVRWTPWSSNHIGPRKDSLTLKAHATLEEMSRKRSQKTDEIPSKRNNPHVGKGGLSLTGVAFMAVLTVLTVLAVLESTLPSFCFSYKLQDREAAVTVLTLSAVSAVMAVSVVTATPLKLTPPPFP